MATAHIEPALIHQKISEIRKRAPRLAKNGVGPSTQGSYKFLSVDDVLDAIVPLENEVGVYSYPVHRETTFHYNPGTDKGDGRVPKENVQAAIDFVFRFVAVEDGSYIDVEVTGEGIDSQDKAVRKATTQAQKVAYILAYSLVTGEQDPDAVNGGSAAQDEPSTPANRAIDRAKQTPKQAPKAPAPKSLTMSEAKKRLQKEYVETGKFTAAELNALHGEYKADGLKGDAIFDKILADLEAGKVS